MRADSFVFMDAKGKRWARFRLLAVLGFVLLFAALVSFVRALYVTPKLTPPVNFQAAEAELKALARQQEKISLSQTPPQWLYARGRAAGSRHKAAPRAEDYIRAAFYTPWDPTSLASLKTNHSHLTHVISEWFEMEDSSGELIDKGDAVLPEFLQENGLALVPMLTNLTGDIWHPEAVENLALGSREKRQNFFSSVLTRLQGLNAAGVLLDWEDIDPSYKDEFTSLLSEFADVLHREHLQLWLSVPVEEDLAVFDLDRLSPVIDRFVALLFDQTGEKDLPGPVAAQDWFELWTSALLDQRDPSQWILGIGNFAYDWPDEGEGQLISFADTMARAHQTAQPDIELTSPMYQPHFSYISDSGNRTVWFLDAITFRNQKFTADRHHTGGIALYRMGTEDPSVWSVIGAGGKLLPKRLRRIATDQQPAHLGKGEFITFEENNTAGLRRVHQDNNKLWSAVYADYPGQSIIYHAAARSSEQVSLTFDDGPDPVFTPLILDILRHKGVKGTFFVMGTKASDYPELLRRIVAEGHELGNHTYSHPNLAVVSENRVILELNATQRVIEAATGFSTTLFRPPYDADSNPSDLAQCRPLAIAQQLGYLPVMESIDLEDWNAVDSAQLLSRLKERRAEGNIVLLHDGGGDRTATVEALPALIDYLKMRGDQIVPLEEMLSAPKSALMPAVVAGERPLAQRVSEIGFVVWRWIEEVSWAFLIIATILVLLRAALILALALAHKRREDKLSLPPASAAAPPVSVVIAAYNEEKVIASTLRSVLATAHAGPLEIVVVDDGSIDATSARVGEIAASEPRVTLLRQPNQGKAAALQNAIAAARHKIVVMLDADTQFCPITIPNLIAPFSDPAVGAVSGHAKVGNSRRWLSKLQALEYICGFNLDRRAYDVWNCITVAPGAISAFKREAISAAGGIATDTQAEDTDLTLNVQRAGYRVCYTSKAPAWTEAPESYRALIKQRTRWAFGTTQCLWKNNDLLFNPRYPGLGFFSLPSLWFFQLFLVALIPIADFMLIVSLVSGNGSAIVGYAAAFLLLDLLTAAAACRMEGERLSTALHIIPMRIVYRPLLSYAVWCSIRRVLRGAWVGWHKQERTGSVKVSLEADLQKAA